jgi:histidyl-tRNA synthetase
LIIGAEIANASGDRDDYLQKQAEAQLRPESELVEKVREVLARHNVSWVNEN